MVTSEKQFARVLVCTLLSDGEIDECDPDDDNNG